jgi:hypothetical protein
MAKIEPKKEDVIIQKNISTILNKPWAKEMLKPYIQQGSQNIQSFTDFKNRLNNANTNVVTKHIKQLCDMGFLQPVTIKRPRKKKKKGYVLIWKNFLNHYFRFYDMKIIQDCTIENIYWDFFHYDERSSSKQTKYVTIYGLEKHYPQIEEILKNTYKKLIKPFNTIYIERFNTIILNECKTIKKYRLKQSVKQWHSELTKKLLIIPPRDAFGNEPIPHIKYIPPKDLEAEFKEITGKIWDQFNKECPSIGIMIQF